MNLQFPLHDIARYARLNIETMSPRDRRLTEEIGEIFPAYRSRRHLTKKEFLVVCEWKTPRSKSHCAKNDESTIKEISGFVLSTSSEALKIQAWTLLSGVKWPTASVFLHFTFPDRYPILDFRALWSLGIEKPPLYTLNLWLEYTKTCRDLAAKAQVSMRSLDQALWKYSHLNQKK